MEPILKRLKRISRMPYSMICRRIHSKIKRAICLLIQISRMPLSILCWKTYCRIKKKTPLPAEAVYDANFAIINLDTCLADGKAHFSGEFVPMKEIAAKRLKVYSNGVLLGETKPGDVNQLGRSPVDIEVNIDSSHDVFEFYLELANGSVDYLGNLELSYLSGLKQYEKELAEKSPKIPPPPPEIIFLTQGNRETDVYLRSIPQAVYKLKQILADIGAPFENMHTILDFGCGSGRLVRGLYLDDPHREIYGADYNEELTAWAKNNLPPAIKFIKNDIDPPLLFEDNKFDLIILVSVFTHLPLECQYKWLSEFKRILKIGGITVVSLQGMAYLNYFKRNVPSAYVSLLRRGYASTGDDLNIASGSNQFFAAHTPDYAFKTLFKDWKILAHLPGGKLRNQLSTINVMGFSGAQDIYVLSK